jgi:hypothetical protein
MKETTTPAWKRMLQIHEQLVAEIKEHRTFLEDPRPEIGTPGYHTWAEALCARLVSLHDKIFRHFREEESSGFLDDLKSSHPQAQAAVTELRSEHGRILKELRNLLSATMAYAEGNPESRCDLRRWNVEILQLLEDHEEKETELTQDVFLTDIGTKD